MVDGFGPSSRLSHPATGKGIYKMTELKPLSEQVRSLRKQHSPEFMRARRMDMNIAREIRLHWIGDRSYPVDVKVFDGDRDTFLGTWRVNFLFGDEYVESSPREITQPFTHFKVIYSRGRRRTEFD